MNVSGFVEIEEKIYQTAHENAWSVECMAGHDAADRSLEYIGSRILPNDYVYDFFQDSDGGWWYQTRKGLREIGIVDIETVIFGPPALRKTNSRGKGKRNYKQNEIIREKTAQGDGPPWEEGGLLSQEAG